MVAPLLQHSIADIMRYALVSVGVGTFPVTAPQIPKSSDWGIYAEGEPSSPDNVVTLYETQGIDDGRDMITGEKFGAYGFQVRIRAVDHKTGILKANQIKTTMELKAGGIYDLGVTIDGINYTVHAVSKIGQILSIGKEVPKTKRSLFTINAVMNVTMV